MQRSSLPIHVEINGRSVTAAPRETLLETALRHGIDFPNSCRVGGCGTCKCRLLEGTVHERTETGYLLSADELNDRYVLACQSVPLCSVRLAVDERDEGLASSIAGRVVEWRLLSPDIGRLTVRLERPLSYRAGQFAELECRALPGVRRPYSMANPPDPTGNVQFVIRRVPGGLLSSFFHDRDPTGEPVEVRGPGGDFHLRDGDAPILMIAGGSGLSPLLAMLHEAAGRGDVHRPVTVLYAARDAADLYATDQVESLQRRWEGDFRFVPVLSRAAAGPAPRVTDRLAEFVTADTHAYLCGPPRLIDAAVPILVSAGVDPAHVYADRFLTRADAAQTVIPSPVTRGTDPSRAEAGVMDYLKYASFSVVGAAVLAALFAGGWVTSAALFGILALYMGGDWLCGDDTSAPRVLRPGVLTALLWTALPLLTLIVFAAVWTASDGDPLGAGAWIRDWSGFDVLAARAATGPGHRLAGILLTGLMIGLIGTIPAHELTHRTWHRPSLLIGRWLLAFSFDTSFSIEHVYGHHRYVSTTEDPATAPRGRNVYMHILMSTLRGNVGAWRIEVDRLAKRRRGAWTIHNVFLRGQAMSLTLLAGAWWMGGAAGAAEFAACGVLGKCLLEVVNYMEHYGMVRRADTPVQPRHSWNTNRRISSWTMFNLTRHSHHHAQGEVPFHDLQPLPDAPLMLGGYLTTIIVALIPPVWHATMIPRLREWDRVHASDDERILAAKANAASGLSI